MASMNQLTRNSIAQLNNIAFNAKKVTKSCRKVSLYSNIHYNILQLLSNVATL